jgi:hypothetical protein
VDAWNVSMEHVQMIPSMMACAVLEESVKMVSACLQEIVQLDSMMHVHRA